MLSPARSKFEVSLASVRPNYAGLRGATIGYSGECWIPVPLPPPDHLRRPVAVHDVQGPVRRATSSCRTANKADAQYLIASRIQR